MSAVVEGARLVDGAREAVEEDALLGVGAVEAVEQHADGELVRHQRALVDEGFRLHAELRLVANVLAEEIAGGHVGDARLLRDQRRLCAFACARRSEQYENQGSVLTPSE